MLEILESGVKIGIGTMECLTRQAGKAALFKDYLGTWNHLNNISH